MLKLPGRLAASLFALCCAAGPLASRAHDLPVDTVMNGFVKVEPRELHLLVRIPLDLLRQINFPQHGGNYDVSALAAPIDQTLTALGRDIIIRENGERLTPVAQAGRLSLPSDRSFESYQAAAAHISQPLPADTAIAFEQGYFDASFAYSIGSPGSVFTFENGVASDLRSVARTTLRYLAPGATPRALLITGSTGAVALNPTWYQAARGFFAMGVEHILSGADHLLFLLCLVLPLRNLRSLLAVVTAFTVAHSVTLLGSAFGLAPRGAWFPPFVETMIAVSIVYMALENIIGADLRRRWLITGLFGLVHGFGFSFALKQDLQFAGSQLLASLLAFNVGIEAGQLAVIAVMLPVLWLLLRGRLAGRVGIIVISVLVAHTGWHWLTDRAEVLWQTPWPALDGEALRTLAWWVVAIIAAAAGGRFLVERVQRPAAGS